MKYEGRLHSQEIRHIIEEGEPDVNLESVFRAGKKEKLEIESICIS